MHSSSFIVKFITFISVNTKYIQEYNTVYIQHSTTQILLYVFYIVWLLYNGVNSDPPTSSYLRVRLTSVITHTVNGCIVALGASDPATLPAADVQHPGRSPATDAK